MEAGEARRDDGFTLIELLIVIVILGVLAAVVVFAVGGISDRGTAAAAAADETTLEIAEEAHMAQFGVYTDEPGLVTAGLLRDESELFDITLASGAASYTVDPAGSAAPPATTPPTTVPSGSSTRHVCRLVRRGIDRLGKQDARDHRRRCRRPPAFWSVLQATPPTDTEVVWLNAGDIATAADLNAIVASGPDYIVASVAIPITTPSGPSFVGSYMNANWPGTFWWTFSRGRNPTVAELETLLTDREAAGGLDDLVVAHEHEVGGVAERHERVECGDALDRTAVTGLDQPRHNTLADTAGVAGLVDDQHTVGLVGVFEYLLDRQRCQPTQVEHATRDAFGRQLACSLERHRQTVRPADDQNTVALTNQATLPDRNVLVGPPIRRCVRGGPHAVAGLE